jgi:tRNA-modifying protein YgfZ
MTVDVGSSHAVVLVDRTHWGRIRVSDRDRLTFLHNQSTQMLNLRKPGEVCDTTFVTSTARTLDLATVAVLAESAIVVVSPQMAQTLIAFLDRYIFFADQVKLTDITAETVMFTVMGSASEETLKTLGLEVTAGVVEGTIAGVPVTAIAGTGLVTPGYTIVAAVGDREVLWTALARTAEVMDGDRFERLRIEQGRPMPGFELTDDYNPLDAGLWNTVSFNKGCYIGQETIARLESRDAVKMGLWGVMLDSQVEPGTTVFVNDDKAGTITSVYGLENGGAIGLCYVRTKAAGLGAIVRVGTLEESQTATLLDLPFVVRGRS